MFYAKCPYLNIWMATLEPCIGRPSSQHSGCDSASGLNKTPRVNQSACLINTKGRERRTQAVTQPSGSSILESAL
jgi:hypothetical protein